MPCNLSRKKVKCKNYFRKLTGLDRAVNVTASVAALNVALVWFGAGAHPRLIMTGFGGVAALCGSTGALGVGALVFA